MVGAVTLPLRSNLGHDSRPRVVDASNRVVCTVYYGGSEMADIIARKTSEALAQMSDHRDVCPKNEDGHAMFMVRPDVLCCHYCGIEAPFKPKEQNCRPIAGRESRA